MTIREALTIRSKTVDFYAPTDMVIRQMTLKFVQMFTDLTPRLLVIDELEILKESKRFYAELDKILRMYLLRLANDIYGESRILDENWLDSILRGYDPVTQYIYDYEWHRKQQRFEESIIAVIEIQGAIDVPLKRAMDLWCNMANQYADTVTDKAFIELMKDNGVTEVQWITAEDEKVCTKCRVLDGKRFPIKEVPPKPHWHCRCRLKPIWGGIL